MYGSDLWFRWREWNDRSCPKSDCQWYVQRGLLSEWVVCWTVSGFSCAHGDSCCAILSFIVILSDGGWVDVVVVM